MKFCRFAFMNQEARIKELLEKHKLKKTTTRMDILRLYLSQSHALSHSDLEQALGSDFDRVTLYRTLHTFEEKGIIHKVPDDSGATKYALCAEACSEHHHHDEHIHFSCTKCGNTYCLDHYPIPKIQLPEEFKTESLHLYAKGICRKCA